MKPFARKVWFKGRTLTLAKVLALAASCGGSVGHSPTGGPKDDDDREAGGSAPGLPPDMLEADTHGEAVCQGKPVPAPGYLRRLSNDEYRDSVAAVLRLPPTMVATNNALKLVTEGFGNDAQALTVSARHVENYGDTAVALAGLALASAQQQKALVSCDLAATKSCLDAFITSVGRRAYRRPLTADEVASFHALASTAAADDDPFMPARLVLEAMLQSPHFLYRVDVGAASKPHPGWRQLTGYEVATRLSFYFLGTTPSDELLDAAAAGELDTAEGVKKTARALLEGAHARAGMDRFLTGWLHLYELENVARDQAAFPAFTPQLRAAMREETHRLLADFTASDGNLLDVLRADYTYVNDDLARLYGFDDGGSGWRRVGLPRGAHRAGVLTHASLLTLPVAGGEVTAPILRGMFLREAFLCTPPPPPPPDIPPVSADASLAVRARLQQHRDNDACRTCHQLLDPLGLGFEQYDLIGRFRDKGSVDEVLTGEGQVFGLPNDPTFRGPEELASLLREAPETPRCLVNHAFSFAHGRKPLVLDACARQEALNSFTNNNFNLQALMLATVASDAFRFVSEAP